MEELGGTDKKERLKAWVKNPHNWALIGIILFALIIRLHFFSISSNQALWWDESEYASSAKHIAMGTPEWMGGTRVPLFPIIASFFYLTGIGEAGVKIFEILLASASVFLIYLITKKLYDKRVAVLTAILSSVFWVTIFWAPRVTTDITAFFLQLLSILFFFNYLEDSKPKSIILASVFIVLAFLVRTQTVLLIAALLLLYLIIKGKEILQHKKLIFGAIIAVIALALFLLTIGKSLFMKFFISPNLSWPVAWNTFSFVPAYLNSLLLVIFLFGLALFLVRIVISFDLIKTNKESKSDLFLLIVLIIWFGFFAFYIRAAEDRWLLLVSLPVFIIISKGLMTIYNFIRKYSKAAAVILIILLLGIGSYFELQNADTIVRSKIDSYMPVKEAGLWLKDNSAKGDIIISASLPQMTYYSERKIEDFYVNGSNENESAFNDKISMLKPRYLVVSLFEPGFTPKWAFDWPQKHNETAVPVKAYFLDAEQKNVALVIYELKY
jgi:4-amino-4-deoxy-L-arabinose transferase-like glycosyltransferase